MEYEDIKALNDFGFFVDQCGECFELVAYSDDGISEVSECTCKGKEVICDDCGNAYVPADMSVIDIRLCLCDKCNGGPEEEG